MKLAAALAFKIICLCLLAFASHAENSVQPPVAQSVVNVEAFQDAEKLASMDELLGLGAPGLALRLVDKYQAQQFDEDINQWLRWERKRIQLLQHLQQWQDIINRVESYNDLLQSQRMSDYDRQWLLTQKVKAYLNLGEADKALYQVQGLLWSVDEYVDSDTISMWRRLIIRAYLNMGAVADAQRAMRRYRQDYGNMGNEDGLQWRLLQARLLLQTGTMADIAELLKDDATAESEALMLLARLKHKVLSSAEIKKIVLKKIGNRKTSAEDLLVYNYVLLKLAIVERDYAQQITVLEGLLVNNAVSILVEVFPTANSEVSANALWQAYESYGRQLANDNRLLIAS